jgi:hypothetical protein
MCWNQKKIQIRVTVSKSFDFRKKGVHLKYELITLKPQCPCTGLFSVNLFRELIDGLGPSAWKMFWNIRVRVGEEQR